MIPYLIPHNLSSTITIVILTIATPHLLHNPLNHNPLNHQLHPTLTFFSLFSHRRNGLQGFYRGLTANLIRVLPATCLTFVTYEHLVRAVQSAGF
eukprot:m.124707 g.124707  ORF g.124707 m.124707 type:complete len:95 (+) comp16300_c2_seq3:39-323(+)